MLPKVDVVLVLFLSRVEMTKKCHLETNTKQKIDPTCHVGVIDMTFYDTFSRHNFMFSKLEFVSPTQHDLSFICMLTYATLSHICLEIDLYGRLTREHLFLLFIITSCFRFT